jgi:hypothetical protein
VRRTDAPAEAFRRFGEAATPGTPARALALALGASPEALEVLAAAPRRPPALVLAALLDLAPELADDGEAAAGVLVREAGAVRATLARRRPAGDESIRAAVLYPAVAEAARRAGADAVGLVDVGRPAALNTAVDRVGVTYDDGRVLGDPSSPVQVRAGVAGGRAVPGRAVPPVVARIGVDRHPLDVTDPGDARWLRACAALDGPERGAAMAAQVALAASVPPDLVRGDPVDALPEALARVPASALPVVTTTWALARLTPARRARFLLRLEEAAAGRAVAWVSAEGVGVAPSVPTLGDRPASGHSLLGVAVSGGAGLRVGTVGRCWSRGRLVAWLPEDRLPTGG